MDRVVVPKLATTKVELAMVTCSRLVVLESSPDRVGWQGARDSGVEDPAAG